MTVSYVEEYSINGTNFGIEDHRDGCPPHEHFFHSDFVGGSRKQFVCWRNGCGIGECCSMREARLIIRDYAVHENKDKKVAAEKELHNSLKVLADLKPGDIFKLAKYLED